MFRLHRPLEGVRRGRQHRRICVFSRYAEPIKACFQGVLPLANLPGQRPSRNWTERSALEGGSAQGGEAPWDRRLKSSKKSKVFIQATSGPEGETTLRRKPLFHPGWGAW